MTEEAKMGEILWHKDLLSLLPDELLINQLSDCVSISEKLMFKGTTDSILTKRITNFLADDFVTYYNLVRAESIKRHLTTNIDLTSFDDQFIRNMSVYAGRSSFANVDYPFLFQGWMSTRYLTQNIIILEILYDNEEIELKDYFKIVNGVRNLNQLSEQSFECLFS